MKNLLSSLLLATLLVGGNAMADEMRQTVYQDRSDVSQLMYKWAFYRDHGMWDELRTTFHAEGTIQVTWFTGEFSEFVDASIKMAEGGAVSVHQIKPSIVDVVGDRAIAITPASITARANPGVELDLSSEAYFFDFVERREGEWKILRRICVYQKDRMDSVLPSLRFWLMSWFVDTETYDPAYKFLGGALAMQGYAIGPQIVDNTNESRALYAEGQAWLTEER
ncbi:SnoaL-like domain protein [Rhodobiaceae bacterium]|nr:SnoaL-like domain protein [Rhodobiaceae bacterium]